MDTKANVKEIVKSSIAIATGLTVALGYFRAVPKTAPLGIKIAAGVGMAGIALIVTRDTRAVLDTAI